MNPKKNSVAGTLESSDVLVTVCPSDALDIEINSIVKAQWGRKIEELVRSVLKMNDVSKAAVTVHDKGAWECTIRARLTTALRRAGAI